MKSWNRLQKKQKQFLKSSSRIRNEYISKWETKFNSNSSGGSNNNKPQTAFTERTHITSTWTIKRNSDFDFGYSIFFRFGRFPHQFGLLLFFPWNARKFKYRRIPPIIFLMNIALFNLLFLMNVSFIDKFCGGKM